MPARIDIRDCSRSFLEGLAKSVARTIDSGTTHNSEGASLPEFLEEILQQIKIAPDYHLDHRGKNR